MAVKRKRKLTRKQKLAGFGGRRAQSAARSSRRGAPVKHKTTKKTAKKKKKTTKSTTNWAATAAAGVGGLLVGGAAGYATHDAVQGLLNNLAAGDIPVLSGVAGLLAGQGNGTAPVIDTPIGDFSGVTIDHPLQLAQAQLGMPVTGEAAAAIASGAAIPFSGQFNSMGNPVGVYQADVPWWQAMQTSSGTRF